jgi:hypothetical protein
MKIKTSILKLFAAIILLIVVKQAADQVFIACLDNIKKFSAFISERLITFLKK